MKSTPVLALLLAVLVPISCSGSVESSADGETAGSAGTGGKPGTTTGSGGAGGMPSGSSTSAGTSSSTTSGATSSSTTSTTSSSSTSSGSVTCAPIDGILAYYPLDDDTLDHSGNGNDAIGAYLVPTPGKVGGAYAFDGQLSSLHATGSTVLSGARTFCAWVDPSPRSGLGQPVFSGGVSDKGDFFSISASSPAGGSCLPPGGVPFIDHWGTPCYEASGTLSPGVWHLVCYAYDGVGGVMLYGDGNVLVASGAEYAYALSTLYLGSTVIGGTSGWGRRCSASVASSSASGLRWTRARASSTSARPVDSTQPPRSGDASVLIRTPRSPLRRSRAPPGRAGVEQGDLRRRGRAHPTTDRGGQDVAAVVEVGDVTA
jgi:hypothetical protein